MAAKLAVCIEDQQCPPGADRYLICVALPAGESGLGLSAGAEVIWKSGEPACDLSVADDGRLQIVRRPQAPAVMISRTGRDLDVSPDAPTVLLDQDEVSIGTRQLRIHIHGPTETVAGPAPYEPEPQMSGTSRVTDVRDTPPKMAADPGEPVVVPVRIEPPAPPRIPGPGGIGTIVIWILLAAAVGGIGFAVYWFFVR